MLAEISGVNQRYTTKCVHNSNVLRTCLARGNTRIILCYIVIYTFIQHHNDTTSKTDAWINDAVTIKMQEGRRKKTSLQIYSPLTLLQGFERLACERMLETEHKLHILTLLLWPSRCVFLVLLDAQPDVLGSTPIGAFPRFPSVGCGFPYHIWSLGVWKSTGNCIGVSEVPLGRVWPSLPHLVFNSLGVCWQLHRGPKLNWVK